MKKNTKTTETNVLTTVKPTNTAGSYWLGLDLGDKVCRYCILNQASEVIERGNVNTRQEELKRQFKPYKGNMIALEVGTHSPWISRLLKEVGLDVVVANPRKVKLITQSRKKSDDKDAEELARLLKADRKLLSPVVHRSEQAQQDLLRIRARAAVVTLRTSAINTLHGLSKSIGMRLPSSDSSDRSVEQVKDWPETHAEIFKPLLTLVSTMTLTIEEYDSAIAENAQEKYPEIKRLMQIPGVGPITAITFVLTLDDKSKFSCSRDVGAYLGLVPARHQSSESDPQMGISREGDSYTRVLAVQCVQFIMSSRGPDSELKRFGLKIAGIDAADGNKKRKDPHSKRRMKIAKVAVARKLVVLMHRLWVTGESYDPFYATKKKEQAKKKTAA